jgi:hypothetical protein
VFERDKIVELYGLTGLVNNQVLDVSRLNMVKLIDNRHRQGGADNLCVAYNLLFESNPLGLGQVATGLSSLLLLHPELCSNLVFECI